MYTWYVELNYTGFDLVNASFSNTFIILMLQKSKSICTKKFGESYKKVKNQYRAV